MNIMAGSVTPCYVNTTGGRKMKIVHKYTKGKSLRHYKCARCGKRPIGGMEKGGDISFLCRKHMNELRETLEHQIPKDQREKFRKGEDIKAGI